jgi:hypothetical protein
MDVLYQDVVRLQASVDDSKERFTHGRPDAQLLRTFCKEKFNWNSDKVDEILEPVLKVSTIFLACLLLVALVCHRAKLGRKRKCMEFSGP